jgi:hypothetical protein
VLFPSISTWGLSATLPPGCGTENEPHCEFVGDFIISQPFNLGPTPAAQKGFFLGILEGPGVTSDIITFTNTGPGGNGEVKFFSDPQDFTALTDALIAAGLTGIQSCTEVQIPPLPGDVGGCITAPVTGLIASNPAFTVTAASDPEFNFDAFGLGGDWGDQIKFTGATAVNGNVPEPAALPLLASGLALMGWFTWRKMRTAA